jgi:hypothetical protein
VADRRGDAPTRLPSLRAAAQEGAGEGPPDPAAIAALGERYGHYFQFETVPEICREYGLTHPMLEMVG